MTDKEVPISSTNSSPIEQSETGSSIPREFRQHMGGAATALEVRSTKHEVGLLSAAEYKIRRSDVFNEGPDVHLDERQEVRRYFEKLTPEYVDNIRGLANLEMPMSNDCKVIVTIPAYNEGSRIRRTLEQYTSQDIGSDRFEIVIFATPVKNDTTPAEIEQFEAEHPEISVIFATQPWSDGEPATVGNGRKYAADIALARILQRDSNEDTIIVTNDADTVHISSDYLSSIVNELQRNESEDALVTELDIPLEAQRKPNVAAAFYLLSEFEEVYATGNLQNGDEVIAEPALTNGRSTAIKTAAYAAIGGYNPEAVISEDWELGWMLADARNWNADRIGFFKNTKLITDPRRVIDTVINRVPTDQQLMGFKDKPELRQLNNDEIIAIVPDSFDWELFQDDVDSIWGSQFSGANKRIPKDRFEAVFDATMRRLGVEYNVTDAGRIEIKSVDGLLGRMKELIGNVEIVHSQLREYTPQMLKEIVDYFSGIPVGVMESRQLMADKITDELRLAQVNGDMARAAQLEREIDRFQLQIN